MKTQAATPGPKTPSKGIRTLHPCIELNWVNGSGVQRSWGGGRAEIGLPGDQFSPRFNQPKVPQSGSVQTCCQALSKTEQDLCISASHFSRTAECLGLCRALVSLPCPPHSFMNSFIQHEKNDSLLCVRHHSRPQDKTPNQTIKAVLTPPASWKVILIVGGKVDRQWGIYVISLESLVQYINEGMKAIG